VRLLCIRIKRTKNNIEIKSNKNNSVREFSNLFVGCNMTMQPEVHNSITRNAIITVMHMQRPMVPMCSANKKKKMILLLFRYCVLIMRHNISIHYVCTGQGPCGFIERITSCLSRSTANRRIYAYVTSDNIDNEHCVYNTIFISTAR
jgi:hypothetical protein